jgi:tetratricopeptide (TPR) repeat protein
MDHRGRSPEGSPISARAEVTTSALAISVNYGLAVGGICGRSAGLRLSLCEERIMRFEIAGVRMTSAMMAALGFCLASGMTLAAGSSPSDTPTCSRGEVYNSSTKKCEKRQAGALPDKNLADYAYALAKAKRYDEAIEVLDLMKNPHTAQALNYRGYATRHMGKLDEGIGYYLQSVRLDPHYAQVREYLGEAYVIKGDLASAKYQLRKIKTICGNTECEEYEDLEKAIEGHPEEG